MQRDQTHNATGLLRRYSNKYVLVGLFFVIWLTFGDKNRFIEKAQIKNKINTLEKEKEYYRKKIEDDKRKTQELLSNRDNLEKFAREQYLMKKSDEDIFIILDK